MYFESFSSPLRFSAVLFLLLFLLLRAPGWIFPLCSGACRGVRFVKGGRGGGLEWK
ncbi:hypothetical protein E2C01_089286 [Portunus trituberculatus]|uniref:Uncharacterized protein n=1 Tax=Portunus trituberculatus TaxID=210409 RepID=A0A5B7JP60_PORTR|nr:hypothetical protein [Portunus trituberculatus]